MSVTIILAAVVGVGIWLFYPRGEAEPDQLAEDQGGLEWEPLDYLRGDEEMPGLESDDPEPDEDDKFVVTYGVRAEEQPSPRPDRGLVTEAPAPVAREDAEARETAPAAETAPRPESAATDAPRPDSAAAESAPRPAREPAPSETAPADRPPEPKPAETAARTPAPAARPSAEAPPSDDELADRAYWVQVISSPSRATVEKAQQTLREHQLGSRVLTKEIGGKAYFRLRLGPFAVREEAEKFLGWVTEIDGFDDSMIFVDYSTAVLAARGR
ncbi:MAG: SPOR domain-containing protein [Spirochaetota bacterium]